MRHLLLLVLTAAMILPLHAREQTELRERIRDAVQRTDKDIATTIHPDKLNAEQRAKFDAIEKDLGEIRDAVANGKWQDERPRFERTITNLDDLVKHAPIDDSDRQTLGIDLYTLRTIEDSWKQ